MRTTMSAVVTVIVVGYLAQFLVSLYPERNSGAQASRTQHIAYCIQGSIRTGIRLEEWVIECRATIKVIIHKVCDQGSREYGNTAKSQGHTPEILKSRRSILVAIERITEHLGHYLSVHPGIVNIVMPVAVLQMRIPI